MATVFEDDFEGDLSAWTVSNDATLEAGEGFKGTQGVLLNASNESIRFNISSGMFTLWCGFFFRVVSSNSTWIHVAGFLADNVLTQTELQLQTSTGDIRVTRSTSVVLDSSAGTDLADGNFHFVEIYNKVANSPDGEMTVIIDDVTLITVTGDDTRETGGAGGIDDITLYGHGVAHPRYFDHFYINDSEFQGRPLFLGLTCSKPANTRATVFTLTGADPDADKSKWEFTPTTGDVFTLNTTSSGTASGNVLQSGIDFLNIWLPPFQDFSVRARQHVNAIWSDWTTPLNCTSRGYENSFDKYNSLNEGTITSG